MSEYAKLNQAESFQTKDAGRNAAHLIADIGGTNARFALYADRVMGPIQHFKVSDFKTPIEAIETFFNAGNRPAELGQAVFAIAAPIVGNQVKLTNADWHVSAKDIEKKFGFKSVKLVNDFVAVAKSIPKLRTEDVLMVGNGVPVPGEMIGVIGPGTGVGVAGLKQGPDTIVIPSEGSHVTMPVSDEYEGRVLSILRQEYGHVSAERVLCGRGFFDIYLAVAKIEGIRALDLTPEEITERAISGACDICTKVFDLYFSFLGTVAGNIALTLNARGGIFIGGGIIPKFSEQVKATRFREQFEAKGGHKGFMSKIPTSIILRADPAFLGMEDFVQS